MVKIYIDAGHGGNDPGAVGNGLKEKELTLDIAKRIKKYLDANYNGHSIKMSRTTDKTLSLSQRTNEANSWGADYFLSIHINAGGGTGYEDYIYNGGVQKRTASIRDTIHIEVVKQIPEVTNRGKKHANLHVTRESRMPSALTENLFIDTKKDADKLKDNSFLDKVAKGHAIGLAKAFKLKSKSGATSKPSSSKPTQSSKPTKKGDQTTNSIVDYLKSIGENSGLANRKKLAKKYGISNYSGTSTQNTKLLKAMRGGSAPKKKTTTALKVGNTVTLKKSA